MIREAIILAGGLGTRLRDAVPDLPKCMAPVAGRPFLFYVINYLKNQGVERFIFSLGYKHELIRDYLDTQFSALDYSIVVEKEPLGTGGAILLAASNIRGEQAIIANGDTLFKADLQAASAFHFQQDSECTLVLKPMKNFDRYGVVKLNDNQSLQSFEEKKWCTEGTINGGLYLLNVKRFRAEGLPEKFSFEKDYLERLYRERRMYGFVQDAYFIDIGIPADYQRAGQELSVPPFDLAAIDKTWTLFLDRDGVINEDKVGSYIFSEGEFKFMEGAPALFKKLTEKFGRIIVVTNQRGVGRGLMTEEALVSIHQKMTGAIEAAGGKIDKIYYATSIDNEHPLRKPHTGMALAAQQDFPAIDFAKSIMIGNNHSDMLFGRNAGLFTVFLATTNPELPFPHPDIDLRFDSLADFTKAL